jgi:hypothetical protein
LEAKFSINENIALKESIPTTLIEQQQLLDALKITLKLAFPTSTVTDSKEAKSIASESVTRTEADGKVSEEKKSTSDKTGTQTKTEEEKSGDTSSLGDPSAFPGVDAAKLPEVLEGDLGRVPLLVRKNALTLLQSVRLLNRSMKDVAVRSGYKPYVVTLQYTMMPYVRSQPLDTYNTTFFFAGGPGMFPDNQPRIKLDAKTVESKALSVKLQNAINKRLGFMVQRMYCKFREARDNDEHSFQLSVKIDPRVIQAELFPALEESGLTRDQALEVAKSMAPDVESKLNLLLSSKTPVLCAHPNPIVVPLLATDNIEASSQARSANFIRQIGVAASAAYQGATGTLSMDKLNQDLISILGEDFNSLMTVGRLTENSLRVRFGAMNQGSTRYAMVPRNHNVHLLLLAPDELLGEKKAMVQLVSRTEFRNLRTGKELKARTPYEVWKLAKQKVQALIPDVSESTMRRLFGYAMTARYGNFVHELEKSGVGVFGPVLWLELSELLIGSKYANAEFELKKPQKPKLPVKPTISQTPILKDDGKQTIVEIGGGANFKNGRFISKE